MSNIADFLEFLDTIKERLENGGGSTPAKITAFITKEDLITYCQRVLALKPGDMVTTNDGDTFMVLQMPNRNFGQITCMRIAEHEGRFFPLMFGGVNIPFFALNLGVGYPISGEEWAEACRKADEACPTVPEAKVSEDTEAQS